MKKCITLHERGSLDKDDFIVIVEFLENKVLMKSSIIKALEDCFYSDSFVRGVEDLPSLDVLEKTKDFNLKYKVCAPEDEGVFWEDSCSINLKTLY